MLMVRDLRWIAQSNKTVGQKSKQHKLLTHVDGEGLGGATDHASHIGGHVVGRHIDVHLNVL